MPESVHILVLNIIALIEIKVNCRCYTQRRKTVEKLSLYL